VIWSISCRRGGPLWSPPTQRLLVMPALVLPTSLSPPQSMISFATPSFSTLPKRGRSTNQRPRHWRDVAAASVFIYGDRTARMFVSTRHHEKSNAMRTHRVIELPRRLRAALILMCAEATSLAVVSPLHLSGLLEGGAGAGIAEAIICGALVWGAISVFRAPLHWRAVSLGTTAFAMVGFAYGLSVTSRGGALANVAYHSASLPLLVVTFGLLVSADRWSAVPGSLDRSQKGYGADREIAPGISVIRRGAAPRSGGTVNR
jgi:hypothetical protein